MTLKEYNHGKGTDRGTLRISALLLTTVVSAAILLAAGAGTAGAFTGCTTLSSPGGYTLDSPITDSGASSCIDITSSDVTLNGQNNVVDGVDGTGTVGINVTNTSTTLTNVTVRNVNVTDWTTGITYRGANSGNVTDVNASDNEVGIRLDASDNVSVTDNEVVRSVENGIFATSGSDDVVVRRNDLVSNSFTGITNFAVNILSSSGGEVVNNEFENNTRSLRVENDALVADNRMNATTVESIIASGANTVVENNTIANGGPGVKANDDNIKIRDNNISGNRGISLDGASNTTVFDNNLTGIDLVAIEIGGTNDSVVRDNTIDGVEGNGIEFGGITPSGNVSVHNNTIRNVALDSDASGISVGFRDARNVNISANEITNVVSVGSFSAGIRFDDSDENTVVDNTVRNAPRGIHLRFDSNNNTLRNNTVVNTTSGVGIGILVAGSSDNRFVNNTATNTESNFVVRDDSQNTTVENLDIGASTAPNTTLDFGAKNVRLRSVDSPPGDPIGIGRFVEATSTSATSFLNITFEYTDSDVAPVNESDLDVWKNNGSWIELGTGPATDIAVNEIQYNVTSVGSVFAPLVDAGFGTPGAGECVDRRDLSRGQESQECPTDRTISRGQSREDIDRRTGRNSDTRRRDRSRGERGRSR